MPRVLGRDSIYRVAEVWRKQCLSQDRSLLWPSLDEPTWTELHLEEFVNALLGNLDTGQGSFTDKWEQQLSGHPGALYRIAADVLTFYSLFPTNWGAASKTKTLDKVVSWHQHDPLELPELSDALSGGLGNPGTLYLTARPWQISYFAAFAKRIKEDSLDPYDFPSVLKASIEVSNEVSKSASARNMVVHLLFPDLTEPISSDSMLHQIASGLSSYCQSEGGIHDQLASIRSNLSKEVGRENFLFWDPDIEPMWKEPFPPDPTGIDPHPVANKRLELLSVFSHISEVSLLEIESLLRAKKQVIFEGPPGSGKTYIARLFARYLAGVGLDDAGSDRVEIVQFHQSYGYEDFVAGIRPVTSESGQLTYRSQPGIFLEMCQRAMERPDEQFVLIIDEINRGNLSRIFGELLYGLEYRDQPVRLQTPIELGEETIEHLRIPSNLYLIGTMNSTDRSLAMIDYALRRRFYFWRMMPTEGNEAPVLRRWLEAQSDVSLAARTQLHNAFVELNQRVAATLGDDYQIGHSYFMLGDGEIGNPAAHARVWRHAIAPLLREYFHTRSDAEATIEQFRIAFFQEPALLDELSDAVELEQ